MTTTIAVDVVVGCCWMEGVAVAVEAMIAIALAGGS
jgi:hypothetical protein